MTLEERAKKWPDILLWQIASGHPAGWRVVREALPTEHCLVQFERNNGKPRFYRTAATARVVTDNLNFKGAK